MSKIKIGVMGAYRGASMINYCKKAANAEVVAICDKWKEALDLQKEQSEGMNIAFYDNFDDFIKHDMDAVVLANYANQHAPFAIRAMKEGKHVFSEVLPVQTMKEAVELIETVEETGMTYAYGENYCYMPANFEMKKLYEKGEIGEFEYAEGEYIHNCDKIWHSLTYGDKNHWRNNLYATYYCTHSLGPIVHITGLRPVSVTGFEGLKVERKRSKGGKSGSFGIEMVTFENGGIAKSIHGDLYKNSYWWSMYGSKGRMESARADADAGYFYHLYLNRDEYPCGYETEKKDSYDPSRGQEEISKNFGHGGADYYCMYNFVEKIKGNPKADTIDVYEAMDMFLPGMFAYRSILAGGIPQEIPNLREKAERDKWRNDTGCTDPSVAGDMLWPTCSTGTPEIDDSVYEYVQKLWNEECNKTEGRYRDMVIKSGTKKFDHSVD